MLQMERALGEPSKGFSLQGELPGALSSHLLSLGRRNVSRPVNLLDLVRGQGAFQPAGQQKGSDSRDLCGETLTALASGLRRLARGRVSDLRPVEKPPARLGFLTTPNKVEGVGRQAEARLQGGLFMKKSTKKLSLSRETVAILENGEELKRIIGGSIISSDNKACTYTALGPNTTCWC
jgi:hypothetical protein